MDGSKANLNIILIGITVLGICSEKSVASCIGSSSDWSCCSSSSPCLEKQGDCDNDNDCSSSLICGQDNCKNFNFRAHKSSDCCVAPKDIPAPSPDTTSAPTSAPTTTPTTITTPTTTAPAPSSGGMCCGVRNTGRIQTRIVNGIDASMNEYPWIAYLSIRGNEGTSLCGGSLIASQWILTASHCLLNLPVKSANRITVTLGEHVVSTTGESSMEKKVSVSKVINYGNHLDWSKDIALLKLERPVSLRTYTPICLPEYGSTWYAGKTAWVYGWGTMSYKGSLADKLQKARLDVISNAECTAAFSNKGYGGRNYRVKKSQLCAGTKSISRTTKDSCQGDSGGPLSYSRSGRHEQVGIVSYGPHDCAVPGIYGIYSNVAYFKDWIDRTISANGGATFLPHC